MPIIACRPCQYDKDMQLTDESSVMMPGGAVCNKSAAVSSAPAECSVGIDISVGMAMLYSSVCLHVQPHAIRCHEDGASQNGTLKKQHARLSEDMGSANAQ
jgi:hypothetical protein